LKAVRSSISAADLRAFEIPAPDLSSKAKPFPVKVKYPVSYYYNGGTIIDHKWYSGYVVEAPFVPDTHELVSMGIGLQLNAHPPYATMLLRPKKED